MKNWKTYIWKDTNNIVVSLAEPNKMKIDCPLAVVPIPLCWSKETIRNKLIAILKFNYTPNKELVKKIANEIFIEEVFGDNTDLGSALFDLMSWHYNRDWKLEDLTKEDIEKANAVEAMTDLSRKKYWEYDSHQLKLKLILKQPIISQLVFPMVIKTPIRSIQYFIDAHSRFIFNSIRKAKHEFADDLISYIYELLILNQKTANSIHALIGHIDKARLNKKDAILTKYELDATTEIDRIISYLKASIEKNIVMLGYTFSIPKLEDKKTHKAKLRILREGIPEIAKKQPYFQFIDEFISSTRLSELNNNRTGMLHKKGISKLQPHSFYGKEKGYKKLNDFFYFVHEQFSKNCAMLIATFALLTDELVKLDWPEIRIEEIPIESLIKNMKEIKADNNR